MPDGPSVEPLSRDRDHTTLRADCTRCVALCCVAPAFARSADFAIDKPAAVPCPNLDPDFRCGIHADLRQRGFAGCTVFDCFGAGQRVTQETFRGADWRSTPDIAGTMFAAFFVMRLLHELLWYLTAALEMPAAKPVHAALQELCAETEALASGSASSVAGLDVEAHRLRVNGVLREAAALARATSPGARLHRRGADLTGADLRSLDLRGADLRGAQLLGADLRGTDLALADLTGADLRAADVRGADLAGALFLTQPQIAAARGDARTTIPQVLARPPHWG